MAARLMLSIKRHLIESIQNLWLYKMRSLLTLLGVLVGTASVVALVSSGELATQHALLQFKSLGTDLYAISLQNDPSATQTQSHQLNLEDVEQLKQSSPDILAAAPYTFSYLPIVIAGQPLEGTIIGSTEALADIAKIQMAQGRFVSKLDRQQYFCTIGTEVADTLRKSGMLNPLGEQIRLGNHYFTIIGIASPWAENMFIYANINRAIIIPIATSLNLSKYTSIQNILFQLRANADITQVQNHVEQSIQKILPKSRVFARSAKEIIGSMQKQKHTFTLMLASIGAISLLVGGIGVMNIMLVSVSERRREIGIRLAIGAKKGDIQGMFLTDAIVLTVFGGLLGVILGELISLVIAVISHWHFKVFMTPLLVGFFVSVLVGIFFGYYPAYKASKLDPIQTLRAE